MQCRYIFFLVCVAIISCAQRQVQIQDQTQSKEIQLGGPCEGCEAALEYGNRKLSWVDTIEDFSDVGPKIEVSGAIYKRDGRTPAEEVILYVYHTDQKGVYPTRGDEKDWGRRHGYLRTWLKTNAHGQYKFYTLRPASYPGTTNPAHIHATIKEPGKQPYYIDAYLFDDDPFLLQKERASQQKRGGNGILTPPTSTGEITRYKRDIVLGLNISGYH
jgi:protocatechuate 3,4-dioxygenase beta subunit